jgi:hypothetical protein
MNPSSFLTWFDGFCQAIEGTPSEKQWQRLLAERAKVGANGSAAPAHDPEDDIVYVLNEKPAPVLPAKSAPPPPLDEGSWRMLFKTALRHLGCPEDQIESISKMEPYNLAMKPADAARAAFSVE